MKAFALFFVIIFGCSCKRTMPDKMWTEPEKDTSVNVTHVEEEVVSNPKAFTAAVTEFITAREDVKQQLTTFTPNQADSLYDVYMPKCYEIATRIQEFEQTFISNYYNYIKYDNNGNVTEVSDTIQRKIDLLDKAGLEIGDIGEGMVEIRPKPEYFLDLFNGHVSPDYQDFLAIEAEDNKVLFDNDAAITIAWKDVGTRVINWENFIAKYPESNLNKRARELYHYYQYAFLVGADNTPVLDYGTNKMYPETREAFEHFIKKYPDSPTSALVKMVLVFKGDGAALDKFVTEQQKLQEAQK